MEHTHLLCGEVVPDSPDQIPEGLRPAATSVTAGATRTPPCGSAGGVPWLFSLGFALRARGLATSRSTVWGAK